MAEQGDKRFDPTQHRIEEARKKGDVAKSGDFIALLTLLAGLATVLLGARYFVIDTKTLMIFLMQEPAWISALERLLTLTLKWVSIAALPITLTSVLAHVAQNAIVFSTEAITPKFDRFNPVNNLKQVFSMESFFKSIKAILTMIVLVLVVRYSVTRMGMVAVGDSITLTPYIKIAAMAVLPLLLWLIAMAIGDLVFTNIRYKHKLKMTVQEMKEENKQTEGDPMIKMRQRQSRVSIMKKRMVEEVTTADVVITNPVHLAIALKYDPDENPAPIVIAKGARKVAEKIKKIAKENKIPVIENPPVAQLLYRFVEVGEMIPPKFYKIVAEILAYIMSKKEKQYAV